MTEPRILNLSDIPKRESRITSTGEGLGLHADFAGLGMSRLRISHETLLPGRRSSSPHWHTKNDEFVFVLKGAPDVLLGGKQHRLKVGDGLALVGGDGVSHVLVNDTSDVVELLSVSSAVEDDEVVYG